jgi:glycosyltransferase involved in cell wall biosynthesis
MTADAVGGVWTYALDLSQGLRAGGWDVVVAVLGPLPQEKRQEAAALGLSLVATDWPLDWTAESADELRRAGTACAALAVDLGADLVHLNTPSLAAERAFTLPTIGVCHSCVATWWDAVQGGELPREFGWRTELLRQGYLACDRLIAPSAAFADQTRDRYGRLPLTVWNGRRQGARRSDPAAKTRDVLTSGRLWDSAKNMETLDRAAAALTQPVRAAGALVGPNLQTASLKSLTVLGSLGRSDLDAELNRAGVFVSAALYEPFGLGVLEAAQAGCALVLSDIPSFRELWRGAARFVPAMNSQALRAALEDLLANEDDRRALALRAHRRAKRYSLSAMTAKTLKVYMEALSSPTQAAA